MNKKIIGILCVLVVILAAKVAVSHFAEVADKNKQVQTGTVSTPAPMEVGLEGGDKAATTARDNLLNVNNYITYELPADWKIECKERNGNLYYKDEFVSQLSLNYIENNMKQIYENEFEKQISCKITKYSDYTIAKIIQDTEISDENGNVKNAREIIYCYYQSDKDNKITSNFLVSFSTLEDVVTEQQLDQVADGIKFKLSQNVDLPKEDIKKAFGDTSSEILDLTDLIFYKLPEGWKIDGSMDGNGDIQYGGEDIGKIQSGIADRTLEKKFKKMISQKKDKKYDTYTVIKMKASDFSDQDETTKQYSNKNIYYYYIRWDYKNKKLLSNDILTMSVKEINVSESQLDQVADGIKLKLE